MEADGLASPDVGGDGEVVTRDAEANELATPDVGGDGGGGHARRGRTSAVRSEYQAESQ